MSDPRKRVVFDGLNAQYATFAIDNSTITYSASEENGSASVGLAVTLSAAGTVALAADAEAIVGKLIRVEADNYALVQVGGFMTLPGGTSAGLTLGLKVVGDLLVADKGYIREVASGTAAEINKGRGQIIDASDTAAVVVNL